MTAKDLDAAVSTMRDRIDRLGVSGAEIRKQLPNQIVIQLPGIHSFAQASKLIGQTGQLELYDLEGDLHSPSINAKGAPVSSTTRYNLLASVQSLAKTSGPPTQFFLYGKNKILLAGPSDTRAGLFTPQHPKLLPGAQVFVVPHGLVLVTCGGLKSQAVICPGGGDPTTVNYYLFNHRPELTGKDLNASGIKQDFDQTGTPIVRLAFTGHGDSVFQKVTQTLWQRGNLVKTSQHFAVVLDDDIKSFPQIDYTDSSLSNGIAGGGEITGIGSVTEAQNIALVLQTGALPVSFKQVGSRILGSPATVAAEEWSRARKPVLLAFETALRQYPKFVKAFTNRGNTSAVRQIALGVERQLDQVRRRWQALPAPHFTDLRQVDSQIEQVMSLAASAYAAYAAGLKANAASGSPLREDKGALALLSSGDAKRNRVGTLLQQLVRRLSALDRKYGTS